MVFIKFIIKDRIMTIKCYLPRISKPFRVLNTWMGDPSKILILEAVLQTIEAEDLLTHVCQVGNYLLCHLNTLQNEFPKVINSVRGRGFMIAFDLVCKDSRDKMIHLLRGRGKATSINMYTNLISLFIVRVPMIQS